IWRVPIFPGCLPMKARMSSLEGRGDLGRGLFTKINSASKTRLDVHMGMSDAGRQGRRPASLRYSATAKPAGGSGAADLASRLAGTGLRLGLGCGLRFLRGLVRRSAGRRGSPARGSAVGGFFVGGFVDSCLGLFLAAAARGPCLQQADRLFERDR